jgi:hypothetical protein
MAPRVPPSAHAPQLVATIAVQGIHKKKLRIVGHCTVLVIEFFEARGDTSSKVLCGRAPSR